MLQYNFKATDIKKETSGYTYMTLSQDFEQLEMDVGRAAHTVTTALDYVGVDDRSHGRRVGLICHRIAHHLGWDRDKRHFILLAGMLHDCGVSS